MYNSNYGRGIPYEMLMLRAFKLVQRDAKRGTCGSIYEQLIRLEDGTALYRKVSPQKQLERVKKWIEKGINAFLKRRLRPEERQALEYLLVKLHSAYYSDELDIIISKALDVTQPYRDYKPKMS